MTGDLIVSGNIYMTNTCGVTGNVYSGGNIVMDAQPTVGGNVFARGNATFQSTAKIGGTLYSGGTFTSPEGKPIDYFTANGSVGGEILPAFDIPEMNVGAFGPAVAQTADYPASTQKTWTQWMNETAKSNNAAPGTPGTSANPGCVMAPWASSVNGTTVHVSTDTVIDAQTGNCPQGLAAGYASHPRRRPDRLRQELRLSRRTNGDLIRWCRALTQRRNSRCA